MALGGQLNPQAKAPNRQRRLTGDILKASINTVTTCKLFNSARLEALHANL